MGNSDGQRVGVWDPGTMATVTMAPLAGKLPGACMREGPVRSLWHVPFFVGCGAEGWAVGVVAEFAAQQDRAA